MVGAALIVAWSFTLTNLGPTPQIVNLGPSPTTSNYVPVEMIVRNAEVNDAQGLQIAFGTNASTPTDVMDFVTAINRDLYTGSGYMSDSMAGSSVIPANKDLYVEYSLPTIYPTTDKPIEIDILAYPLTTQPPTKKEK